jgi:hypothetical protein
MMVGLFCLLAAPEAEMRSRGLAAGKSVWQHDIRPDQPFDHCFLGSRSVITCEGLAIVGFEDLVTSRRESDGSAALADALVLRPGST